MGENPQRQGESQVTDLVIDGGPEVSGTFGEPDRPPPTEDRSEEPEARTEEFGGYIDEIRTRLGSDVAFPFPRLEDVIRRWFGIPPLSWSAAALAAAISIGVRLALALLATALAGQWAEIPWVRWMAILVFYGLMDATQPRRTPPLDVAPRPWERALVEDWTALLPTIVQESDLRDLADFTRRRYRLAVAVAVGSVVAVTLLLSCWLFAPDAFRELPAGSIVLLAFLLFDFGSHAVYDPAPAIMTREARLDHHLFWPSPGDSPEVRSAMRMITFFALATGMWMTLYLGLAVVLVSWNSAVVFPLAVGFIVLGYLTTIGSALRVRAGVERIVERAREQRLRGLRRSIDRFGPKSDDLSLQESEHLRNLIELHKMIRDAPTTPTTSHTMRHAAVGLIIPTIMFVVTVFGEVYAERVLDTILP